MIGGTDHEDIEKVIRSMSSRAQIPFIDTHWKISPRPPDPYSINLYPDPALVAEASARKLERGNNFVVTIYFRIFPAQAIRDVILDMDWESFTAIYESPESLIRIKALLMHFNYGHSDPTKAVKIIQMSPEADFR